MSIYKILAAIAATLLVVGIVWKTKFSNQTLKKWQRGNSTIYLEVADSESERSQGLSGHTLLEPNRGLLFIFPTVGSYSFWMKDMKFPLDFVWVREKHVVDLTENVPAPKDSDETKLQFYQPREPVDEVIELNAGMIEKFGIKIGDILQY